MRKLDKVLRLATVAAAVAVVALAGPVGSAGAAGGFEVIAKNLDNPRGITFGGDGAMYVAEAGRGGAGPCVSGPEGGQVCYGATGAVTRVDRGTQERIATGLPSLAGEGGNGATGPHDVAVRPGRRYYVVVGLGANPDARAALGAAGAGFGKLYRFNNKNRGSAVSDVAGYEKAANPDGNPPDSNPYSITMYGNRTVIADAGGNDLVEVSPSGKVITLAVFPNRTVPSPLPQGPREIPMQAVPNSVVVGPDGAYYVGQLTGFPFPVGGARVYRVVPGKAPEVFAEGFTNIIDLDWGPDGSLYVLEITKNGLLQAFGPNGDFTGELIRIAPGGQRTEIASQGLFAPTSVSIGPDRGIYVSNKGVLAGAGEVIRVGYAPKGK